MTRKIIIDRRDAYSERRREGETTTDYYYRVKRENLQRIRNWDSIKVEGFWSSKDEPDYPMPVPNVLTQEESEIIYDLIKEKEKIAYIDFYGGYSYSRITDEILGCREFSLNGWIWTGDFAQHYVLEHKCKPTDEFLDFIGYENTKKDGSKGCPAMYYLLEMYGKNGKS